MSTKCYLCHEFGPPPFQKQREEEPASVLVENIFEKKELFYNRELIFELLYIKKIQMILLFFSW